MFRHWGSSTSWQDILSIYTTLTTKGQTYINKATSSFSTALTAYHHSRAFYPLSFFPPASIFSRKSGLILCCVRHCDVCEHPVPLRHHTLGLGARSLAHTHSRFLVRWNFCLNSDVRLLIWSCGICFGRVWHGKPFCQRGLVGNTTRDGILFLWTESNSLSRKTRLWWNLI